MLPPLATVGPSPTLYSHVATWQAIHGMCYKLTTVGTPAYSYNYSWPDHLWLAHHAVDPLKCTNAIEERWFGWL